MNRGLVPQPAGSAGRKGRRSVNQCKTESTSSQGESIHQKKRKTVTGKNQLYETRNEENPSGQIFQVLLCGMSWVTKHPFSVTLQRGVIK